MPVAKSASDKNPVNRVNQSEFRVLERQKEAKNPSKKGAHYPKLSQVAHPHIGAFNSLFSFGSGTGLLETAVNLIPHVSVFDGERAAPVSQRNKIECRFFRFALSLFDTLHAVEETFLDSSEIWIKNFSLSWSSINSSSRLF